MSDEVLENLLRLHLKELKQVLGDQVREEKPFTWAVVESIEIDRITNADWLEDLGIDVEDFVHVVNTLTKSRPYLNSLMTINDEARYEILDLAMLLISGARTFYST